MDRMMGGEGWSLWRLRVPGSAVLYLLRSSLAYRNMEERERLEALGLGGDGEIRWIDGYVRVDLSSLISFAEAIDAPGMTSLTFEGEGYLMGVPYVDVPGILEGISEDMGR